MLYWQIGKRINAEILKGERAKYGEEIIATLSQELIKEYGQGFNYSALTRMVRFAEVFPDSEIVATLSQQLSWSPELLSQKVLEEKLHKAVEHASHRFENLKAQKGL